MAVRAGQYLEVPVAFDSGDLRLHFDHKELANAFEFRRW